VTAETWDDVVARLADRPELHDAWLNGLAYNRAATGSVLWRIITVGQRLEHRSFWLEHRELTQEAGAMLVRHPDRKVRFQLTDNPSLTLDALAVLAKDADSRVRRFARESLEWRDRTLYRELFPQLRDTAPAGGAPTEQPTSAAPLTRAEAQAMVASPDRSVRGGAAWDERVPQAIALSLADDPDDWVRLRLSMRKDLSEEQREAIPYVVPDGRHQVPDWLTELREDPQAIAWYARSSHVLIRRSVAMARHLPSEAVAVLAKDEDFFVRLTLAEYCDDAPHELIIEMFTSWKGLMWSRLTERPNFVRTGMAENFATDPDPRLRWAALFDPTASPELVEILSHDPDSMVCPWAVSDPRLPLARLHEALGTPRTALAAARNPGSGSTANVPGSMSTGIWIPFP
jgi:hypothetical protein